MTAVSSIRYFSPASSPVTVPLGHQVPVLVEFPSAAPPPVSFTCLKLMTYVTTEKL